MITKADFVEIPEGAAYSGMKYPRFVVARYFLDGRKFGAAVPVDESNLIESVEAVREALIHIANSVGTIVQYRAGGRVPITEDDDNTGLFGEWFNILPTGNVKLQRDATDSGGVWAVWLRARKGKGRTAIEELERHLNREGVELNDREAVRTSIAPVTGEAPPK